MRWRNPAETRPLMREWWVLGYYDDSGQSYVDRVFAADQFEAFRTCPGARDADFVCYAAIPVDALRRTSWEEWVVGPSTIEDLLGESNPARDEENPRRMRPAPLEDYEIPFRNIAEALWGRGGTHSYRTTRPGFRYYSCSGHGGYVVDGRKLTPDEKRELDAHDFEPETLHVLVQSLTPTAPKYVVGTDMSPFSRYGGRGVRRTWRYDTSKGEVEWHDIPVYLFEEDCDWALVERVTGVRLVGNLPPTHDDAIEETYQRWHASRRRRDPRLELGGHIVENPNYI